MDDRPTPRFVLGSASPARLATLRAAGIEPEVLVSGADEDNVRADTPADLALELARRKASAVAAKLTGEPGDEPLLILGCDTVLELDGEHLGKPGSAEIARERWLRMRGRSGLLHTGHCVIELSTGRTVDAVGTTVVHFADISIAEIDAYIATGEPLLVAGAFTIDGLGGPFIERIEGDHHNVVGVSLPLVRRLLAKLDISWPSVWARRK